MERLLSQDPDDIMPPPEEGKAFARGEASFARWIEQGASMRDIGPLSPSAVWIHHRWKTLIFPISIASFWFDCKSRVLIFRLLPALPIGCGA